jgi:hypothetical protein
MHLRIASWGVLSFRTRLIRFQLPGHQLCSMFGNEVEFTH